MRGVAASECFGVLCGHRTGQSLRLRVVWKRNLADFDCLTLFASAAQLHRGSLSKSVTGLESGSRMCELA